MTIARAVNSSDLSHIEHRQCDADTLHALGRSAKKGKFPPNPLGVALLHVRDGLDGHRYKECLELFGVACVKLVQKSRQESVRVLHRGLVKKAAEMVLKEYLADICPTCLGADLFDLGGRKSQRRKEESTVTIGNRRKLDRRFVCPECNGTKKVKPNHEARCIVLGINRETYNRVWERLIPEFANILLVAERHCRANVSQLLEGA